MTRDRPASRLGTMAMAALFAISGVLVLTQDPLDRTRYGLPVWVLGIGLVAIGLALPFVVFRRGR